MGDSRQSLIKAAEIAQIRLTENETDRLVSEIEEVLLVFSKIDKFEDYVKNTDELSEREFRRDLPLKSGIDPFSNSSLVKERKFVGPRLIDENR